jgi:hypothetical protein
MEQQPADAVARAVAFSNGLRKNVTTAGRRWTQWPGGAAALASVVASIDAVGQRLLAARNDPAPEPAVATAVADLRAILEWTTYQSGALATARAVLVARKTRTLAERFGLLERGAPSIAVLVDSEQDLIANVRTRNGYMLALAERHPHLGLPPPLVSPESLAPKPERVPGKLDLIAALTKKPRAR